MVRGRQHVDHLLSCQSMDMDVKLEYVSVGCNRTPHSVDWAPSGLLAYGADRSIALARESRNGCGPDHVIGMLHGHKERVNCVQWMTWRSEHAQSVYAKATPLELVSGSVDNDVIVWRQSTESKEEFALEQVLTGHTGPVTCLATLHLPSPKSTNEIVEEVAAESASSFSTLIASGSADSSLILWERKDFRSCFEVLQTLSFGRGFVLGVELFSLPGLPSEPLLACGGDDARVNLFVRQEGKFVRVMSLLGHEDWIRDLHCIQEDGSGDLLLASCAQDAYIRLWRVARKDKATPPPSTISAATSEEGDGVVDEDEGELKLTGNVFLVVGEGKVSHQYTVTLESVLMGHEDWVYSVRWQPCVVDPSAAGSSHHQPLSLLSASMDKTMVLWQPDPASGVWLEQVRVGEVGGNTLGLYGGVFGPHGDLILAHGYQGAFHLWKRAATVTRSSSSPSSSVATAATNQLSELWEPQPTLSGHFGPVQDISWEPETGGFLISVSLDQTSRLHAPWMVANTRTAGEGDEKPLPGHMTWQEVARPQIHGYDMQCVAMTTSLQYVSGADEKVMRVFEAPRNFVGNLQRISQVNLAVASEDLPLGATVPSLGLSNKAIFKTTADADGGADQTASGGAAKNAFGDNVPVFTSIDLDKPPVEEHLLQNTLWPETQKLYGHGYEVFCVASSPDGKYVASACKASKPEHAVIRVWDSISWRQAAILPHHSLTVTQLAFSHSGEHLLAVSRDRCWSLWKQSHDEALFKLAAHIDKTSRTHSRIIWSCAWSHDDACFATASRDKKVYLWSQKSSTEGGKDCDDGWRVSSPPLECSTAVTAVHFAPAQMRDQRYLLAVGLESGAISLYSCCPTASMSADTGSSSPTYWSPLLSLPPSLAHTSTVKRLQWRPGRLHRQLHRSSVHQSECDSQSGEAQGDGLLTTADAGHHLELLLASCSTDHTVKLYSITSSNIV